MVPSRSTDPSVDTKAGAPASTNAWLAFGSSIAATTIFPEWSDGLSVPEKLVILVVPAEAAADVGEVCDELQALDPLHLLEPELRLVAQPEGRAVVGWQSLPFMS